MRCSVTSPVSLQFGETNISLFLWRILHRQTGTRRLKPSLQPAVLSDLLYQLAEKIMGNGDQFRMLAKLIEEGKELLEHVC